VLTSIMNYPDRGKWGDSSYRGNCSGYVIKDLLQHFKPKGFMEIFAGGGTGFDVARELGYQNSLHLDLNPRWGGFNVLKDEIPEGTDFCFMHYPYHDIIQYSGFGGKGGWGDKTHDDDLSRCPSYEDFIRKVDKVNAKVYSSLRNGGRMAVLLGDVRRSGEYFSIIKDMMYIGSLESHIIKLQHNCFSDQKHYNGKLIRILHEHLLIFKKNEIWMVPLAVTKKMVMDMRNSDTLTWRDLIQGTMEQLGGTSNLDALYSKIEGTKKAQKNPHWKEKVRQTLQINKEFSSVDRGVWQLTQLGSQKAA
jgi:hypothetical protein